MVSLRRPKSVRKETAKAADMPYPKKTISSSPDQAGLGRIAKNLATTSCSMVHEGSKEEVARTSKRPKRENDGPATGGHDKLLSFPNGKA
jgi:hypothetical protein